MHGQSQAWTLCAASAGYIVGGAVMAVFSKNYVPGDQHDAAKPSKVRVPLFHVPTPLYVVWLIVKAFWVGLGRILLGIYYAAKYGWITGPVLAMAYLAIGHGWKWALVAAIVAAALLVLWWWRWRVAFWRYLGWFYLAQWRRYMVYRPLWHATTSNLRLATSFDGERFYPSIVKVRRDRHGDVVTVRMLPGQHPDDWAKVAPRFAYTFHAPACEAEQDTRSGRIVLRFRHFDSLAGLVKALPAMEAADMRGLPVAVDANGTQWRLSLVGHVVIAGASGAGKAGVLWSIVTALAPAIRAGLVRIYGFDAKGGMELAIGAGLFHRFYFDTLDQMAGALEDLGKEMRRRIDVLRGHTRNHMASIEQPAVVILIDELAALTAYVDDKKLKDRIKNALSILLSQGRAAQFHVVAALQDPRKEVLPFRNLFATRIALRLNEESEVALVLHDDSIDRGAACHLIPVDQPGVAYVIGQGTAVPQRIRFPYLSDKQIAELADINRPGGWVVNR